jgi:thiamine biosynthesis lipoprotein ApbE
VSLHYRTPNEYRLGLAHLRLPEADYKEQVDRLVAAINGTTNQSSSSSDISRLSHSYAETVPLREAGPAAIAKAGSRRRLLISRQPVDGR